MITIKPTDIALDVAMQALLTEAKNTLGFNEGEYTMFIAGQPDVSPSMPSVVMVVQANPSQQIPKAQPHIVGVCEAINTLITDRADILPVMNVNSYLSTTYFVQYIDEKTATISIIQQA